MSSSASASASVATAAGAAGVDGPPADPVVLQAAASGLAGNYQKGLKMLEEAEKKNPHNETRR